MIFFKIMWEKLFKYIRTLLLPQIVDKYQDKLHTQTSELSWPNQYTCARPKMSSARECLRFVNEITGNVWSIMSNIEVTSAKSLRRFWRSSLSLCVSSSNRNRAQMFVFRRCEWQWTWSQLFCDIENIYRQIPISSHSDHTQKKTV